MKRRSIFAALAAFFTGQAMGQDDGNVACFNPHPRLGCIGPKANQCPVCGTMAEPYRRTFECVGFRLGADRPTVDYQFPCEAEKSRVTRCKRCNAAFWQDAEGEK